MLGYEADCRALKEWLEVQNTVIDAFAPPAITVDALKAQLTEVEVSIE